MEIEEMKNLWSASAQPANVKSKIELNALVKERSNPVLKKIKIQLLLEIALWLILLSVYYSGFDGEKRTLFVNGLFVVGLFQAIIYNTVHYLAAKNLINGNDMMNSIFNYTLKLKKLRWGAIGSRVLLMTSLVLFFSYGLEMNSKRMVSLVAIISILGLQLWILYRQWANRISKLEQINEWLI